MTVRFYNPREASAESLETLLVGRDALLAELLEDLRRQTSSESRQHWLLRGPRGIGKTHLLGVLYHRVRRDPALSAAYVPVWLPESDAYTVYSTGMLLLQVAEELVEELRELDAAAAEEIKASLAELPPEGDDPVLFEEAAQLLKQASASRGKVLLVLMENLDAMLAGFRGGREARRFRALLSEDQELLFLSSTPTRYLRHLSDPREPLYGHLRERTLEPLTEEEVGQLFERYQEATGRDVTLGRGGEARMRRRVLHRLTGGNPRAVIMAFSVLKGAPGLRAMVEEMSALLDAQTAYFEARLAQLAPRERSIVAAMALATENLTLQEIASATRLPARSLSTQVKRLVEEGHLAPTFGSGGKGTIYELRDGLFRIWYQYRKGRKRLEPLVHFLALWHSPEELENALADLFSVHEGPGSPLQVDLLETTARQVEEALRLARSPIGEAEKERLWGEVWAEEGAEIDHLWNQASSASKQGNNEHLEALQQELMRRVQQQNYPERLIAQALITASWCKILRRDLEGALSQLDEVDSRLGDAPAPEVHGSLLLTHHIRGKLLARLGRPAEAASPLRRTLTVLDALGHKEVPAVAEWRVDTLLDLAKAVDQAGETEEAIRHYREVLQSKSEVHCREARGLLAGALIERASGWAEDGRLDEAIGAVQEAIQHLKTRDERKLRFLHTTAWAGLIALRLQQEQSVERREVHEAMAVWGSLLDTLEDAHPWWKALAGLAGLGLAVQLRAVGWIEEASAVLKGLPLPEFQEFTSHVRRVLEEVGPKRGRTAEDSSARRRLRRAVARVPPELRDLVNEFADLTIGGRFTEQVFLSPQLAAEATKGPTGKTSSAPAKRCTTTGGG